MFKKIDYGYGDKNLKTVGPEELMTNEDPLEKCLNYKT